MNRYFFFGLILMTALSYLGFTAEAKETGRSLAAVSPIKARMGQAEQMLYRTTKSSPEFARPVAQKSPVRVTGVCRDSNGVSHASYQASYASCVESLNRTSSGVSVDDYFGQAQRQAGAGLGVRIGQ